MHFLSLFEASYILTYSSSLALVKECGYRCAVEFLISLQFSDENLCSVFQYLCSVFESCVLVIRGYTLQGELFYF